MPTASRKRRIKTKAKTSRPKAKPVHKSTKARPPEKKVHAEKKGHAAKKPAPAPPPKNGGPAKPTAQAAPAAPPTPKAPAARKSSRRSSLSQRRGPDGQLLAPGELLLPGGPLTMEEILYLFRGSVAAEHPALEAGVEEVLAKRSFPDPQAVRVELTKQIDAVGRRFESGTIEPQLPARSQAARRNFAGVVERAKLRRREIGAFLRGLHIGRTESSHMDSHGEASLQSLMEWAARLENLMEAEEPDQADYNQFHRGLDHLENTTEALMVDVEATLRRLRDRIRAS